MTEKEIYENGVALLEEWEDVNYCEHNFKFKDEWLTDKEVVDLLSQLNDENEQLIMEKESWKQSWIEEMEAQEEQSKCILKLVKENDKLKSENKRLTDKLNETALEFLNYDMVSMGKATEISEMCYSDFLKFRKENGNPMELQE